MSQVAQPSWDEVFAARGGGGAPQPEPSWDDVFAARQQPKAREWEPGPDHTEDQDWQNQVVENQPPNGQIPAAPPTGWFNTQPRPVQPVQGQSTLSAPSQRPPQPIPMPGPMPPQWDGPTMQETPGQGQAGFFGNAGRAIKETVVENLPPGVQQAIGYNPNLPVRMQDRPSDPGAGQFVGRAIGGMVPSTQHPESLVAAIGPAGLIAPGLREAGAAMDAAAPLMAGTRQVPSVAGGMVNTAEHMAGPLIARIEELAGPRVANTLKSAIGGAGGSAPMGMIEEAQSNPDEWVTRPAEKLGKVMLAGMSAAAAGGIGGAPFGALRGVKAEPGVAAETRPGGEMGPTPATERTEPTETQSPQSVHSPHDQTVPQGAPHEPPVQQEAQPTWSEVQRVKEEAAQAQGQPSPVQPQGQPGGDRVPAGGAEEQPANGDKLRSGRVLTDQLRAIADRVIELEAEPRPSTMHPDEYTRAITDLSIHAVGNGLGLKKSGYGGAEGSYSVAEIRRALADAGFSGDAPIRDLVNARLSERGATDEPLPQQTKQVQPTQGETGPAAGGAEPVGARGGNRAEEVRQGGDGTQGGGGEAEVAAEPTAPKPPHRMTTAALRAELEAAGVELPGKPTRGELVSGVKQLRKQQATGVLPEPATPNVAKPKSGPSRPGIGGGTVDVPITPERQSIIERVLDAGANRYDVEQIIGEEAADRYIKLRAGGESPASAVIKAMYWDQPTLPRGPQAPESLSGDAPNRGVQRQAADRGDANGEGAAGARRPAARVPAPEAPARSPRKGEFSRSGIERELIEWHRNAPDPAQSSELSEGEASTASYDNITTHFGGKYPGEIRDWLKEHPEARFRFKQNVPNGKAEDVLGTLGADEYLRRVEGLMGDKAQAAAEAAMRMKDMDPRAGFLGFLHDTMPPGDVYKKVNGKRVLVRASERPPIHVIDKPAELPDGTELSIHGRKFTVVRDGSDAYLTDAGTPGEGAMEGLNVGGLTLPIHGIDSIPVDAGTLKLPEVKKAEKPSTSTEFHPFKMGLPPSQGSLLDVAPERPGYLKTGEWQRKEFEYTPPSTGDPIKDAQDAKIREKWGKVEDQTPSMFTEPRGETTKGTPTPETPKTFPHSPEDTPRSDIGKGGPGAAAAGNPHVQTPEEHLGSAGFFGRMGAFLDALTGRARDAGQAVSDATSIRSMPATVRAAPDAAEHLITHASAPQVAKVMGRKAAAEILGPLAGDADKVNRLGAMRNEDTLRATRASLQRMADEARAEGNDELAVELDKKAANVKTLVGTRAFKTEADYQAAWKDPELKAASDRWDSFEQNVLTPMHEELNGRVMDRGPNGTFTNLLAVDPDNPETAHLKTAQSPGELSTARRKGSVHNIQRTGTGEYSTWVPDMIVHGIGDNLSRVELERGYRALVDAGLAEIREPGEPAPIIDGKQAAKIEVQRKGAPAGDGRVRTLIQNLWVRPDLAGEIRNATTKRTGYEDGLLQRVSHAATYVQTKLGVDAAYHIVNDIAGIANSPGGRTFAADLARKFPGVNIADALTRIGRSYTDAVSNDPAVLGELERLARVGALRTADPTTLVDKIDTASRLALSRMYDHLVDRGLAADTPEGRREFVNRVGQYNSRLQPRMIRLARAVGLSPFVTAGRTFNSLGRKALGAAVGLDTGGVKPVDAASSLQLRAQQLAGAAFAATLPALWNYLSVGTPLGRPGVPAGAIDTGKDFQGKPVYIDPLKWTMIRRGMRATGAGKLIEGIRYGRPIGSMTQDAMQDALLSIAHPFAGPAVQVGAMLATGETVGGYDRAPAAPPGGNKYLERAKSALSLLNPTAGPFVEGAVRTVTGEGDTGSQARDALIEAGRRFAGAAGINTGTPPADWKRTKAETREYRFDQRRQMQHR